MSNHDGRRKERYDSGVSVRLTLKEVKDGPVIAGPSAGRFSNISVSGAAVLVTPIRFGQYHLVDTPLDNPSQLLELDLNEFSIPCRPVWYHLDTTSKGKGHEQYKVGVEFMRQPSEYELTKMTTTQEDDSQGPVSRTLKKIVAWFKS